MFTASYVNCQKQILMNFGTEHKTGIFYNEKSDGVNLHVLFSIISSVEVREKVWIIALKIHY